jgi:molybdenum cofactor cytidylyltransferase
VNPGYREGHATSLRAGIHGLPERCDVVAVALADQALIEPADVRDVLMAYGRRGPSTRVVVPRAGGRRGHPVLLDHATCHDILEREPGFGVREWLAQHPSEVEWFDVEHVRYVTDLDTPEDVERIARQHGCTLRWPR